VQFAVDVLKVRHVIVCGHYGCGGVQAALEGRPLGLSDTWLRYVREVRDAHLEQLNALPEAQRFERLCELNVASQALNVARTSVLRDAWSRGQSVRIHGWIYAISNGLLRDLGMSISSVEDAPKRFEEAVQNLSNKPESREVKV
jgi:carbonic anhydrase